MHRDKYENMSKTNEIKENKITLHLIKEKLEMTS